MERDLGPLADGAANLHITRWTIVVSSAQSQAPGGEPALARSCRNYWHPLYLFARGRDEEIHAFYEALVASGGRLGS